jgi:hypothetical protein
MSSRFERHDVDPRTDRRPPRICGKRVGVNRLAVLAGLPYVF